ncbi:hypothetical protein [Peribacillus asahii]|uniref:hypothetical protein n=1 Tax=Peribacillus asahii TaxID=228899 RepID=UPI00207A7AF8|nr:hypothetical protein [Peribacillus asahii]USK59313.1 hypothetical protein LIT37_19410 [Peribacillus asahii]
MLKRFISGFLMIVVISCIYLYAPEAPRNQEETALAQTFVENEEWFIPNRYIPDDLYVTEVGQSITDSKGELTLLAKVTEIAPIVVGPIEFMIKDVKVIRVVPNNSMMNLFQAYTKKQEFDMIKMSVEIHNTSSDTVQFTPVNRLETTDGEQKTEEDNLFLEEMQGAFAGGDVKRGDIGFILDDQAKSTLQGIHIFTSDAVNTNGTVFEQGKEIEINF